MASSLHRLGAALPHAGFFLVAGLFLSRTIDTPWADYLDRKVLHFVYFFVLWTLIQGAPKLLLAGGDPLSILSDLAFAMVEPFGTLWFIYQLPIFFVTTKLLRRAPPWAVLAAASALQMANIATHSTVIDEFAARYVYFYAGYVYAPRIFVFAEAARANLQRTVPALILWGVTNELVVRCGYSDLPAVLLLLGCAGAAAVVAFSALLAEVRVLLQLARRAFDRRLSGFTLPMAITRIALLKTGLVGDGSVIALIITAVAVYVPIIIRTLTLTTPFEFLFERPLFSGRAPHAFRLTPASRPCRRRVSSRRIASHACERHACVPLSLALRIRGNEQTCSGVIAALVAATHAAPTRKAESLSRNNAASSPRMSQCLGMDARDKRGHDMAAPASVARALTIAERRRVKRGRDEPGVSRPRR